MYGKGLCSGMDRSHVMDLDWTRDCRWKCFWMPPRNGFADQRFVNPLCNYVTYPRDGFHILGELNVEVSDSRTKSRNGPKIKTKNCLDPFVWNSSAKDPKTTSFNSVTLFFRGFAGHLHTCSKKWLFSPRSYGNPA